MTFVLQMRKNAEKTSPRQVVRTGDRTRARCVTGAHASACPTAVDTLYPIIKTITNKFLLDSTQDTTISCTVSRNTTQTQIFIIGLQYTE